MGEGLNRFYSRGFALLAVWMILSGVAHAQGGKLKLQIIDADSGMTVPARVRVTDAEGRDLIADDALLVGGDCDVSSIDQENYDFSRSLAKLSKAASHGFDRSTQYFYSTGESVISVPAGSVKVQVFKGPEYRVSEFMVTVPEAEMTHRQVSLQRMANMPAKGWYSADDHLHIGRSVPALNPFVSKMMQAEDLHVANLLQMGKENDFGIARQYAHGPEGEYREGNYILAAGQENPRTHILGHTITLGAEKSLHDPTTHLLYRRLWQEAKAQGGLNGYAHFGRGGHGEEYGIAVLLPHRLMHFLEVLNVNIAFYEIWYDMLNLGFRITPTAGSDYPCGANLPGHERFYTQVHGDFTYANWLAGVEAGRTFVTTGPLLEFSIDGQGLGSDIVLTEPGMVRIKGKVWFDPQRDAMDKIELVENGKVILSVPRRGDQEVIQFDIEHPVSDSSWLALRGYHMELPHKHQLWMQTHGSIVHSAPIYVSVENSLPLNQQFRVSGIAAVWLARLNELEQRVSDEAFGIGHDLAIKEDFVSMENFRRSRQALLKEINEAQRYFKNLTAVRE